MSAESKSEMLLRALRRDLQDIGLNMKEFSRQVIEQGISQFPVYVAFEKACGIGKPFANKELTGLRFHYNASVLEEFVSRGIVAEDKVEDFMSAYSDPMEKVCILLLLDEGANMIFVPFE